MYYHILWMYSTWSWMYYHILWMYSTWSWMYYHILWMHSTWSWMYYHILWMFFNSRMPIFVVLSNIEFTWMPYYNRYIFIWWQIFLIVCFATIYDDWHDTNNTEFTVPMWRKLK
jgi:hypothetical protein